MNLHDIITTATDRCHYAKYNFYIKDQHFSVTCFWKKAIGYNLSFSIYTQIIEQGQAIAAGFECFHKIKSSSMADFFIARMLLTDTVTEIFAKWKRTNEIDNIEYPISPQIAEAFENLFTQLK